MSESFLEKMNLHQMKMYEIGFSIMVSVQCLMKMVVKCVNLIIFSSASGGLADVRVISVPDLPSGYCYGGFRRALCVM